MKVGPPKRQHHSHYAAASEGSRIDDLIESSAERVGLTLRSAGDPTPHEFGFLIIGSPLTGEVTGRSGRDDAINDFGRPACRIRYRVKDGEGVLQRLRRERQMVLGTEPKAEGDAEADPGD